MVINLKFGLFKVVRTSRRSVTRMFLFIFTKPFDCPARASRSAARARDGRRVSLKLERKQKTEKPTETQRKSLKQIDALVKLKKWFEYNQGCQMAIARF